MNKKSGLTSAGVAILAYAVANLITQSANIYDAFTENKSFNYEVDNDELSVTGNVKYSVVSKWFLVEVKENNELNSIRIVNEDGVDVLTDEKVTTIYKLEDSYVSLDDFVLNLESLATYLVGDYEKKLYSAVDVKNLIDLISINYNWHRDKTLKIAY